VKDQDFERLYAEHAPGLLGFLVYRTGDRVWAEDLLADTFELVLRKRRRFDPRKGSEKAWVYTLALNLLRDQARRRATEARALERAEVPVAVGMPSDQIEARDSIQRALEVLSSEEREAISLRYGGDMTVPEIAKVTRERVSTIEGRVYRALRKLRSELG
jgi:RNA polymerase sigma-70 factor, ECF subfamily